MHHLATVVAQANGNLETTQLIVGIVSLVLGVLILIMPRLLNYIVAAYLIIVGILFIIGAF